MAVFSYIIVALQKLGHHIGKEQEKYMWNDIIWYNGRPDRLEMMLRNESINQSLDTMKFRKIQTPCRRNFC